MYEVIEKRKLLPDGTEISTYTREVISANILEVEAGTTGYMGGDSGHGGRTYFRISDCGSTDMEVRTFVDRTAVTALRVPRRRLRTGDHNPCAQVHHRGAGGRVQGGV